MDLEVEQEVVPEVEQVQAQVPEVPVDPVGPVEAQDQVHTYHTLKLKALPMVLLELPVLMHQTDTTPEDTGISQFMMLTEIM